MATVTPSGAILGARVDGINLGRELSPQDFELILESLGRHGVLKFAAQQISTLQLKDFAARFGKLEINVANAYQEPGIPEVMVLSNIVENGRPIGMADAGQDWHTD
ncbi:MAG: TauD/TfdA family dioxygenase, partial [Proteobacteria bacterium]|nr:TauD/TfdA family dioxygenase [Pseudomonadota bacterium]